MLTSDGEKSLLEVGVPGSCLGAWLLHQDRIQDLGWAGWFGFVLAVEVLLWRCSYITAVVRVIYPSGFAVRGQDSLLFLYAPL